MDLTIKLDSETLNIRVAILLKTKNGYIFEKHKNGYLFAIGGRIKLNESSMEAAVRELKEELLMSDEDFNIKLKLRVLIENFLEMKNSENDYEHVHEICFVYEAEEVYGGLLREEYFIEVLPEDFAKHDIRPTVLLDLINDKSGEFRNVLVGK